MFSEEFLKKEVYCITLDDGNTLVYAPLTRFFAIYEGLVAKDDIISEIENEAASLMNVPNFVRDRGFSLDSKKVRLRLNITSSCNLFCSYCSVNSNEIPATKKKDMPDSIAFTVIKFFIEYAVQNNKEHLEIVFSGGEPTLKIEQIERIINFALNEVRDESIMVSFRLITNGVFSWRKIKPIIHFFREVQVSWDGIFPNHPRYGNNYLLINNIVLGNITRLLESNLPVSVLVVVTEQNYSIIRDVVDDLYNLGIRHIFLALKDILGRSKNQGLSVDQNILSTSYIELWQYYRDLDVNINLGGTDIHSISPFPCSVPAPNYSISPDGIISSCTTTFNDDSENVSDFTIGSVDGCSVNLNERAIANMGKFQVTNISGCSDCFAKWHCRGGCIYSKQGNWFSPLHSSVCSLIKSIIIQKILIIIKEQSN